MTTRCTRSSAAWLVTGLLLAAGPALGSEDLATAADVGQVMAGPDFELLGLDGARHRLSDVRGQVVLVNFWATWCVSCRTEIPGLNALYGEYTSRGVTFFGISTDAEGAAKVVPYAEEIGIVYPVLLDPLAVSAAIFGGLQGYPMTFIFDREGLIYSSYLGAQDEAVFRRDIEYLLAAEASLAAPLIVGADAN